MWTTDTGRCFARQVDRRSRESSIHVTVARGHDAIGQSDLDALSAHAKVETSALPLQF